MRRGGVSSFKSAQISVYLLNFHFDQTEWRYTALLNGLESKGTKSVIISFHSNVHGRRF